jgi:hypothetical protein
MGKELQVSVCLSNTVTSTSIARKMYARANSHADETIVSLADKAMPDSKLLEVASFCNGNNRHGQRVKLGEEDHVVAFLTRRY